MENYLVIFALVVAGIGYLVFLYFQSQQEVRTELDEFKAAYYLKNSLMDEYELSFFTELKKQLPAEYHVFTKVRIEDFIGVRKKIERSQHFRGYVRARHLDFLICDDHMKPVMAIELDGSSHENIKTKKVDERKNQICAAVNLKLERVKVGGDFTAEANRVKNEMAMPVRMSV